jgi:hypothetical protein
VAQSGVCVDFIIGKSRMGVNKGFGRGFCNKSDNEETGQASVDRVKNWVERPFGAETG